MPALVLGWRKTGLVRLNRDGRAGLWVQGCLVLAEQKTGLLTLNKDGTTGSGYRQGCLVLARQKTELLTFKWGWKSRVWVQGCLVLTQQKTGLLTLNKDGTAGSGYRGEETLPGKVYVYALLAEGGVGDVRFLSARARLS